MRTREELNKQLSWKLQPSNIDYLRIILEIVLDIRDMVEDIKEEVDMVEDW